MARRGAAAAADDVEEAALGELFDDLGGFRRQFVVLAEFVRQAGVRVRGNVGAGLVRQLLEVRAQFTGAEGAVQADGNRLGVGHGVPEGFGGLARQGAARSVGDGAGNHDRQFDAQFFEYALYGKDRGLGVEGVEDGFDQDQVGAAFDQAAGRFGVVLYQQVEGDIAKARVVDVRGNRARTAGRAEHAGDEAWLVRGFQGLGITDLAGQAGTFDVQFVHQGFHAVVGLGHLGGVEGVGLEDVCTGVQVGLLDGTNHVGAGQYQQVVVALDVARPVGEALATIVVLLEAIALDHGTHAAIENQNALFEGLLKCLETSAAVRHRTT
ncbi:hypothetical protein D9M71_237870 [compost metagenome]